MAQLIDDSRPFLTWLVDWYNGLPSEGLSSLIEDAGGADKVAILAVDVTVGFCSQGALSSERVGGHCGAHRRAFSAGPRPGGEALCAAPGYAL